MLLFMLTNKPMIELFGLKVRLLVLSVMDYFTNITKMFHNFALFSAQMGL